MRKISLLLIVFFAISMASCKKDYICDCTTSINAGTTGNSTSNTGKMKKSAAETKCNEGDNTTTVSGVTTKTECSLRD